MIRRFLLCLAVLSCWLAPANINAAPREAPAIFKVPNATVVKACGDGILYGASRAPAVVKNLTAGPIRMKFQDGELRYLYVGNREIIRRVYFAVRDKDFDTVMPEFTTIDVREANGGFTVKLAADCTGPTADYRWTGEITGTREGVITFHVQGQPNRAFVTPRVGLCILFGAESLAGQAFTGIDKDGNEHQHVFPTDVKPALLTNVNFNALRYTTADGTRLELNMTGAGFGIEDQRNYCDSSFKAYHALGYQPGAEIRPGEMREDSLTISVTGGKPATPAPAPARITLGNPRQGATMPKIVPAGEKPAEEFYVISGKYDRLKDAAKVAWSYNVAMHLPDDDMFMENLSTIIDQARTVRSFTRAGASLRIDAAGFDAPYPRPRRDARNFSLFGAAWTAAFAGYAGRAGISEVAFATGPGPADTARQWLAAAANRTMLDITLEDYGPQSLATFAYQDAAGPAVWMVNMTDRPRQVEVLNLPSGRASVSRLTAGAVERGSVIDQYVDIHGVPFRTTVLPFEVYVLRVREKK